MADNLTVKELEINITTNADKASQSLDKLAESLVKLKSSKDGFSLSKVIDNIKKLGQTIEELDTDKIEKFSEAMSKIANSSELMKSVGRLSTIIKDTQQVLNGTKVSVDELEKQKLDIDNLTGAYKENTDAMKEDKKATDDDSKAHKKGAKNVKQHSGAFAKLIKSIGRVAFYRAIRSLIRSITDAIKEGVGNLYQFDKTLNGSFSKSLDRLTTATQTLKNSLGLAFSPVLEAITPMVESASYSLVDLNNKIAEISAVLSGDTSFTKATKAVKAYGDALKNSLAIDELNVVGDSQNGMAYEIVEVSEQAKVIAESFTNLKNEMGEFLENVSTTIKEVFDLVGGILKTLNDTEALSSIVSIVNSLLESVGDILETLEPVIDQIVDIAGTLITNLTPAIEPILDLVVNIVKYLEPILDTALDAIEPIVDLLGNELGEALKFIAETLGSAVEFVTDLNEAFEPINESVAQLFGAFVTGGDNVGAISDNIDTIGTQLDKVKPVIKAIGELIKPISTSVALVLAPAFTAVYNVIKNIDKSFNNFKTNFDDLLKGELSLSEFIGDTFDGLGDKLKKIFVTPFVQAFADIKLAFATQPTLWDVIKENIADLGEKLTKWLVTPFKNAWSQIKSVFTGEEVEVEPITDEKGWLDIATSTEADPDNAGKNIFEKIGDWFKGIFKADGGVVPSGQMFVANEAGPELVGNIGNTTAVMNNGQIVEAVSSGVARAVSSVMGNGSNNNFNIKLEVDGKQLNTTIKKIQKEQGATIGGKGLVYGG